MQARWPICILAVHQKVVKAEEPLQVEGSRVNLNQKHQGPKGRFNRVIEYRDWTQFSPPLFLPSHVILSSFAS